MIRLKFMRTKYNGYNTLRMKHGDKELLSDVIHIYDKDNNLIGIMDKPYGSEDIQLSLMEGAYAQSGSHFGKMK